MPFSAEEARQLWNVHAAGQLFQGCSYKYGASPCLDHSCLLTFNAPLQRPHLYLLRTVPFSQRNAPDTTVFHLRSRTSDSQHTMLWETKLVAWDGHVKQCNILVRHFSPRLRIQTGTSEVVWTRRRGVERGTLRRGRSVALSLSRASAQRRLGDWKGQIRTSVCKKALRRRVAVR